MDGEYQKKRPVSNRDTDPGRGLFWPAFCRNMKTMSVLLRAFAVLTIFIASQALAGAADNKSNRVLDPVQNVKYEYYEVCGCSEKDLQCDLKLKGVKCKDGKKYDSTTNWTLTWHYNRNKHSNTCTTDAFTVSVDIIFRLPKWARDAKAPEQLAAKWDSYVKNVFAHESGHKDRAVKAAVELTQTIADLPPARTCWELDQEVNRIARARVNKLYDEQTEYDMATNHGMSQGVLFP
jgi:predicted secreted Zn-dependent protease